LLQHPIDQFRLFDAVDLFGVVARDPVNWYDALPALNRMPSDD
jgi:hypothetical protein